MNYPYGIAFSINEENIDWVREIATLLRDTVSEGTIFQIEWSEAGITGPDAATPNP